MNDNDFRLYHHGVLGQKWGVRRYQNYDGSLTETGRKRLGIRIERSAGSRKSDTLREARSKDISKLSDDELKAYNKRLEEERKFADLTKGNVSAGKNYAAQIGKQVVSGIIAGTVIAAGTKFVKRKFNME